jgi:hypothetical protein
MKRKLTKWRVLDPRKERFCVTCRDRIAIFSVYLSKQYSPYIGQHISKDDDNSKQNLVEPHSIAAPSQKGIDIDNITCARLRFLLLFLVFFFINSFSISLSSHFQENTMSCHTGELYSSFYFLAWYNDYDKICYLVGGWFSFYQLTNFFYQILTDILRVWPLYIKKILKKHS